MNKHFKKLVAPVIITVLLVTYLMFFVRMWVIVPVPLKTRIIGMAIPLSLIGVSVFVLFERIKEIRGGEEDDLSKY